MMVGSRVFNDGMVRGEDGLMDDEKEGDESYLMQNMLDI